MSVPDCVMSVNNDGTVGLETITQQLDKSLPGTKPLGPSGGEDSGFSSRNSLASERVTQSSKSEKVDRVMVDDDEGDENTPGVECHIPSRRDDGCRVWGVLVGVSKLVAIVGLLYLFICSLDLLGNAFKLLGGKAAGRVFSQSELLLNPITGLMIGILATVLLQSSSTSTSIIITMVSSGIIEVQPAIPIVMGCNIGTTVTNTLVSLAHSSKGKEFERAFSGATVHDVFNWLTVLILLPLEASTHMLYKLTDQILISADFSSFKGKKQDLLKKLTKPLTKMIVQVDKQVISDIAENKPGAEDRRVLKTWCEVVEVNNTNFHTVNNTNFQTVNQTQCDSSFHATLNHFHASLSDTEAGAILLVFSLLILTGCLVCLVKVLNSILKNKITKILKKIVNSKLPYPFAWFTGYLAILAGAGLTILVQSSSVFTSALTPLVGVGCLKLRRMYPLTLGSNIGTTATGILAALAAPANKMDVALQLALCHLFFNIIGISLFYPVHPMRMVPLNAAKLLGKTTARYRWFAVFYLVVLFFFVPGCIFALSLAGKIPFIIIMSVIGAVVLFIVIIKLLQKYKKNVLPAVLQDWKFIPKCLRSLEPLDKFFRKIVSILPKTSCCDKSDVENQKGEGHHQTEAEEEDDEDDNDDDDGAIEEDECTVLFRKLCCHGDKGVKLRQKGEDEGYVEPEEQDLLQGDRKFHLSTPIFNPLGHKHIHLPHLIHPSPSATPLLQAISTV